MRTENVEFYSEGERISALWRTPDSPAEQLYRAIVQGPGWLGLKDAKLYTRYHQALTDAGFAVLVFDYRGFGESAGDRTLLSPSRQLQDLVNAVTYLTSRDDVHPETIGVFGSGGTGGGNAVLLAGADPRVRAAVSQVPVADGADWLRRMRSEHEWLAFLAGLEEDRATRVLTGKGRLVHPREEIMVPTAERRATSIKSDVDDRVPSAVSLSAADEILQYRPIDAARRLRTPVLIIAVDKDATTPTDHAVALFEAAQGPKRLLMQRNTSHYAAYDRHWEAVTPQIVKWFETYLTTGDVIARSGADGAETVEYL